MLLESRKVTMISLMAGWKHDGKLVLGAQ